MKISILTLFPEMFSGPFDHSIVKRAQEKELITIDFVNIRDFASDNYKSVDDHPYGGGVGMVLRVDVIDRALASVIANSCPERSRRVSSRPTPTRTKVRYYKTRTILLDPQGTPYTQKKAVELSHLDHLILLCGHYEGVDERIRSLVDEEISIGDYITTGGEIPAMVIVDSVTRLLPGVLKKEEATQTESFSPILEYPQYTRPEAYGGMNVPEVLLSGNHAVIAKWRKKQATLRTKKRRPDLLI